MTLRAKLTKDQVSAELADPATTPERRRELLDYASSQIVRNVGIALLWWSLPAIMFLAVIGIVMLILSL